MSEDNKKRKATTTPDQPPAKEHKTKSSPTNKDKDNKDPQESKKENESPGFQFVNFTGDQESDPELKFETHYESLPPVVKRRVAALEKLQDQVSDIQGQYNSEYFKLLSKYDKLYDPIFKKRSDVIVGNYEPKKDDLPADYKPEQDDPKSEEVKGVPEFWFHVLLVSPFNNLIVEDDEKILAHLVDIRAPHLSSENFALEFFFSPNPFFENQVLKRTFEFDVDRFGQRHISKTQGTPIKWKPEHAENESEIIGLFSKPEFISTKKPDAEEEDDDEDSEQMINMTTWQSIADAATTLRDIFVPSPVIWFKAPIHRDVDYNDFCGDFGDEFGGEDDDDDEDEEQEEEEEEEEKPKKGKGPVASRGKPTKGCH